MPCLWPYFPLEYPFYVTISRPLNLAILHSFQSFFCAELTCCLNQGFHIFWLGIGTECTARAEDNSASLGRLNNGLHLTTHVLRRTNAHGITRIDIMERQSFHSRNYQHTEFCQ